MNFLNVSGGLNVPNDGSCMSTIVDLARKHHAHVVLVKRAGLMLESIPNSIEPGDEGEFLRFLFELGKATLGQVHGEYEVWWPMAVESGPQWWSIEENGRLYVVESQIVRGAPQEYEPV